MDLNCPDPKEPIAPSQLIHTYTKHKHTQVHVLVQIQGSLWYAYIKRHLRRQIAGMNDSINSRFGIRQLGRYLCYAQSSNQGKEWGILQALWCYCYLVMLRWAVFTLYVYSVPCWAPSHCYPTVAGIWRGMSMYYLFVSLFLFPNLLAVTRPADRCCV